MIVRIAITLAALAAVGCSSSSSSKPAQPTSTSTTMHFSGAVRRDTGSGQPATVSGVEVRASVDRNGDGAIGAGEFVTVQSDAQGAYTLDIPVAQGDLVVLRFSRSGSGTVYRAVRSAPGGSMVTSATLKDLESLACNATTGACTTQSGLVVNGLPAGTGGSARVFNPVTETGAFPGDFNDSSGNLLQSGVFASFALEDGSGAPLERLSTPATIKMKMPRDTWPVVRDITPGTDRIEVPLYAFDEARGTWVREGTGHLENEAGDLVPESDAASIRAGTYTGTIFAVGEVSHFSSWNCDWPVTSHGRVGGEVGECWWNGERKPCSGATVTARGVTYTGTSTPFTVGADGRFGIDVMRSEGTGEDLDGNGVTGETSRVAVRVVWNGQVYDLGSVTMPSTATSNGSATADMGRVVLDESNRVRPTLCQVNGVLRRANGTPVTDGTGTIYSWDEEVPSDVVISMCFQGNQYLCKPVATVDPTGAFSVVVPEMGALTVYGWSMREPTPAISEYGWGTRTFTSCPPGPITLTLDTGWRAVTPTVSVTGATISWSPAEYGAAILSVVPGTSGAEPYKWFVGSDAPMSSPVGYGVLPAGATQAWPASGAPAPLASQDQISIYLSGVSADGFAYWGWATTTLP
jgi:hypothetical protein